jgi:isocitrate/isopropylmalate dehydrogenase
MLLDFLGETAAGAALLRAVEASVADPATRTADLGGRASTAEAGAAVRAAL